MEDNIKIPISWIKEYITFIKGLEYDYEPDAIGLDDVVKCEFERMIDTYLDEEVAD